MKQEVLRCDKDLRKIGEKVNYGCFQSKLEKLSLKNQ